MVGASAAMTLAAAACGSGGGGGSSPTDASSSSVSVATSGGGTLKLLAYDAFVTPKALKDFTAETGIEVEVLKGGDAGTMVNKAILTAGKPEGDVMWGVDNTFLLPRPSTPSVFDPVQSPRARTGSTACTTLVPGHEATPVDYGDVCINYDKAWFAGKGITPPTDAGRPRPKPAYKGLLVVENPATSSPGLAFLLATIAKFGDDGSTPTGTRCAHNGVKVVDGWDDGLLRRVHRGGGRRRSRSSSATASSPPAEVLDAAGAEADRADDGLDRRNVLPPGRVRRRAARHDARGRGARS